MKTNCFHRLVVNNCRHVRTERKGPEVDSVKTRQVPRHYWRNPSTQRNAFDWIADQLNIKTYSDWYSITSSDICQLGYHRLLKGHHNGSVLLALQSIYPEFDWDPLSFSQTPRNYWKNEHHRRSEFDRIASCLGIQQQEDWYGVTVKDMHKHGAQSILRKYYGSSPIAALQSVYPEFEWNPSMCSNSPLYYWNAETNHRKYLDVLGEELGIERQEDWYGFNYKELVNRLKDTPLIRFYNNSFFAALKSIYTEFEWNPLQFSWKNSTGKRSFKHQLGLKDWDNTTLRKILQRGGHLLRGGDDSSIKSALQSVCEDLKLNPSVFKHVPLRFWKSLQNQRKFFDWVSEQLDIEVQEDWYKINGSDIKSLGGVNVLQCHQGSLFKALQMVYPEYEWDALKFEVLPKHYLTLNEHKQKIVEQVTDELDIKDFHEWFSVSLGGKAAGRLQRCGGLFNALEIVYPEYDWSASHVASEGQHTLQDLLQTLVNAKVEVEHKLWSPDSGTYYQLDVYIPEYSLAFEYQGRQHYHSIDCGAYSLDARTARDEEKRRICRELGITLIEIPYWWDFTKNRLITTIKKHRPDILLNGT